jgi:radical SAM superfamily enzyme YgiQ (UPF0313 family)
MRPVLIGPVTIELDPVGRPNLAKSAWNGYEPPLGVLTLASALRAGGTEPIVFDLDGFLRDFLAREGRPQDAFDAAVYALASLDTPLFGFGTICGSYPLTIRLAEQVRRLRPESRVVMGGPQASAVDVKTLEEFDFIDAVVRGEADQTIVEALRQISSGDVVSVPGVTYRRSRRVVRNPDAPVVLDLDAVAAPAFDLCGNIRHSRRLPVEIGRGCPFACTFCSTNDFFRRRFRLRSPARVLREMRRLELLFGVTDFDLVHDMFTVDRKRVVEFCHFMRAAGTTYTWHCSARTDFVDGELLETMSAAGCESLFFGIETGSPRLQKIIGKELGIPEAAAAVEQTDARHMRSTVSLIVGFPEETIDDLNATATFALNAARFDSCHIQVGMLAPLAGTPIHREWRDKLVFDGIIPELSQEGWGQDEADLALIKRYPDLFSSFYGLPAGVGRDYTGKFRWFLKYALGSCRWLTIALGLHQRSFTEIYDMWLDWGAPRRSSVGYYGTSGFAEDLCRFVVCSFVQQRLGNGSPASDPVEIMSIYYGKLYAILRGPAPAQPKAGGECPRVAPNVTMLDFPFHPTRVIEALRSRKALDEDCFQPATAAFRREEDRMIEGRELAPLAAAVLRLCDGNTSAAQIARALGSSCPDVPGLSTEDFVLAGLRSLSSQGLVEMAEPQCLAAAAN